MTVLARAGEFYPALTLFMPRLEAGRLRAAGYVCNRPLRPGVKLLVLVQRDGQWGIAPDSPAFRSLALEPTHDTFASPIELEQLL